MLISSPPFVTYYSPSQNQASTSGTGAELDRVELSRATFDNWVAKTCNLLVDECDLGAHGASDKSVSIELPLHWLSAVFVRSAWNLGARLNSNPESSTVRIVGAIDSETAITQSGPDQFVIACALSGDVSLDEALAEASEISPAAINYTDEVRMYPDSFSGATPINGEDIALSTNERDWTAADLSSIAAEFSDLERLRPGAPIVLGPSWNKVRLPSGTAQAILLGSLPHDTGATLVMAPHATVTQLAHIARQENAQILDNS